MSIFTKPAKQNDSNKNETTQPKKSTPSLHNTIQNSLIFQTKVSFLFLLTIQSGGFGIPLDLPRTTPTAMLMVVVVVVMVVMMVVVMLLPFKLLPHVIRIFSIRIILSLHIMNLVPQGLGVQIESRTVALAHVQGHILGTEHLCGRIQHKTMKTNI